MGKRRYPGRTGSGYCTFRVDSGFRFDSKNKKLYFEDTLHAVADQNRVASRRDETPTNGYVTAELTGGRQLCQRMELTTRVLNLRITLTSSPQSKKSVYRKTIA